MVELAQTAPRSGKDLIAASRAYQKEMRGTSWWHVASTAMVLVILGCILFLAPWWWVRLPVAVVQGLVIVRGFILYHDFMHNALLRGSRPAKWLMYAYGVLVLTPPNVWRQTHNYHHAHTAKIVGSHVGSYLMVTTEMWADMNWRQKLMYRMIRHPVTISFGYFTIFLYGMCTASFLRNPRKNWDSALALVVHALLGTWLWTNFGFQTFLFLYFTPLFIATAVGAYLFYAQHNFPDIHVQPRDEWDYVRAALQSSSYMETGPILAWFTGNIGYHHVHHLNPGIPFYRLPEAMQGLPELQQPRRTSLRPRDVVACFAQKLWDPDAKHMVGYPS